MRCFLLFFRFGELVAEFFPQRVVFLEQGFHKEQGAEQSVGYLVNVCAECGIGVPFAFEAVDEASCILDVLLELYCGLDDFVRVGVQESFAVLHECVLDGKSVLVDQVFVLVFLHCFHPPVFFAEGLIKSCCVATSSPRQRITLNDVVVPVRAQDHNSPELPQYVSRVPSSARCQQESENENV